MNKDRFVSELLGAGSGGGELHKLTIYYERFKEKTQGSVEALFNPGEISLTRSAKWEQQQTVGQGGSSGSKVEQEFRAIEAEQFSIELFFDTYGSQSNAVSDVRLYTDKIAKLTEVDNELHRPPVCDLRWGVFDIFTGVLATLNQRFTLFLDDGTPVRATLTCDFVEVGTQAQARATEWHSADVIKTRIVQRYDTLQSLAADEYGDPALWRPIATANAVVNPRYLQPGTILVIPKLRP